MIPCQSRDTVGVCGIARFIKSTRRCSMTYVPPDVFLTASSDARMLLKLDRPVYVAMVGATTIRRGGQCEKAKDIN